MPPQEERQKSEPQSLGPPTMSRSRGQNSLELVLVGRVLAAACIREASVMLVLADACIRSDASTR